MTFDENINGRAEPEGHSIDLPGVNLPIQRFIGPRLITLGPNWMRGIGFFVKSVFIMPKPLDPLDLWFSLSGQTRMTFRSASD